MERSYLLWIPLAVLATASAVRGQSCSHQLQVVAGQEYYIANPSYPNRYAPGTSCIWTLRTLPGSYVYLSCNVELPSTRNCFADKFYVSQTGNTQFGDARIYCGNSSFSLFSQNNVMAIGLYGPVRTPGGRFICTTTAVKRDDTPVPDQTDGVCDCGWRQTNRIVGGEETGIHEFPFMTGITYNGNFLCGASLISDRFALSAGHCVLDKNPAQLHLLVGAHNINTEDDTPNYAVYNVDAFEVHPRYVASPQKNDIAIIRSATQIYFNPSIGPVCLPFRYSYQTFAGQLVTLIGWGQVEFNGQNSNVLQKTDVYVVSNSQCASQQNEAILNGDLCTYYPNEARDACQFDSGGPVVWLDPSTQRYQLVGIISHGPACGLPSPAINTRVTEYLQWIIDRTSVGYCVK